MPAKEILDLMEKQQINAFHIIQGNIIRFFTNLIYIHLFRLVSFTQLSITEMHDFDAIAKNSDKAFHSRVNKVLHSNH